MKLSISLICLLWIAPHISQQQQQANITKRRLSEEGNYGNQNTIWFYTENLKPQVILRSTENGIVSSKPLAIVELQPVKIVEPPKEILHSALYGIQEQKPTHLIRDLKQILTPPIHLNREIHEIKAPGFQNANPRVVTSETSVSPVQHNQVLTDHNNYAIPRMQPLFNTQPTFQISNKKYAYVNGKIIYEHSDFRNHLLPPSQHQLHTAPNLFPPQHLNKQEQTNFHNFLHSPVPSASLSTPVIQQTPVVPEPSRKFEPPKPSAEFLPVAGQPQRTYRKKIKIKERPINKKDDSSEQLEDDEEEVLYENVNQKDVYDDEDDHQLRYKNDNEQSEEKHDNGRNYSKTRYVKSKLKKYPKKKYTDDYYNNDKYEFPDRNNWRKNGRKHKNYNKGQRFPKHLEEPDTEFSENVLVRKRKFLKEINFNK